MICTEITITMYTYNIFVLLVEYVLTLIISLYLYRIHLLIVFLISDVLFGFSYRKNKRNKRDKMHRKSGEIKINLL